MTEAISRPIFDHLVHLAALDLDEAEAEYLRRELNSQLKAIHELEAIPVDPEMSTTSHGVPYPPETRPGLRADEWDPFPRPQDILAQAPETEADFIVVPDIPHTELQ
jgi:aspartyl-tRNA(Asn)/glutamyl-tRNA(Gln) amidotransferase subunit C